jgi:DNA-binding MarR family transcriptional regulator
LCDPPFVEEGAAVPQGRDPKGKTEARLRTVQVRAASSRAAPPEAFDLERHVFYWITQVIGRRDRQLNGELRAFGLRVPEWRVLAFLAARPNLTMGDVAAAAALDHTTLSRTVDRLAAADLIARRHDAGDLRVTRLALTAKGEARFAEVWPIVERLNRAATALLPPGAVDLLCLALRTMREGLDRSLADDAAARIERAA